MEIKWSLEELYSSFTSEEYKIDMEKLKVVIEEINQWTESVVENNSNPKEKLEGYVIKFTEMYDLVSRLGAFIQLTISASTSDVEALKQSDILDSLIAKTVIANTKLEKWISSIESIETVISKSQLLSDHKFGLLNIVEKSKYLLSDKEENIIANMRLTGSTAWEKLKDKLISTHKVTVDIDGQTQELPLTAVLNMAYDSDSEVRKKAYEAEIASYNKIEEGLASALNGIKGEVLTVCDLRGYSSPLEETLVNSRMDMESLDAMLSAMKESMPSFRKYLRKKAEILGYKNGLPFYDMYAPIVSSEKKYTYEEAGKFIQKNFGTFSSNLSAYAKKAIDNNWIDVYPREGKVSGAFCANLHGIGESRLLLNYGGTFSDVVTFAHELGHGFHGECLKDESTLNSDYPMPVAETASIFCETIVKKAAIKEASKEESLAILEAEISGANQVIVDIYSRFLFEKSLFEKRRESALSVEEIKELMLNAQKEAYGEGLDPEYLHPYMWTWKPHYYYAGYNFYNFPYAFGLLFAKGLYAEYLNRGETFPQEYEKLLAITGKNKVADVTKVMGIDISDKNFWKSSLKTIEEDIEQFIKLSDELL